MRFRLWAAYFALLGAATLLFGCLQVAADLFDREISAGPLSVPQDLWGGLVLFFAGIFMIDGAPKLRDVHGLGKTMLGSIMLWIVAGCGIFARIMTPIFGEEGWANAPGGFLSVLGPPYPPAFFLLPFSLLIIRFIRSG